MSVPTMLDHLTRQLSTLSLSHDVLVNVITSQPKRTGALFPNIEDPPRVWLEECLVTVTTEADEVENGVAAGAALPKRKLLVAALEVYIYTVPATSSTLIYISKVDSTGYSPSPGQLRTPAFTRAMMKGVLSFYLSKETAPTRRVFLHLFARSQNQYLFPNSITGGAKRVAGGAKLCAWWKSLMEEIVIQVLKDDPERSRKIETPSTTPPQISTANLTYILPSYEVSEARGLLGVPKHTLPDGVAWQYLPPYHPTLPNPLLAEISADPQTCSIATLIPTFSDDPKARFLTELLEEGQAAKHQRQAAAKDPEDGAGRAGHAAKRQRTGHNASLQDIKRVKHEVQDEARSQRAIILAEVSYDEFWERMGFRQECASGDVTGFFGVSICWPSVTGQDGPVATSDRPQNIDGPPAKPSAIAPAVFARVVAALLNHDFGSRQLATSATEQYLASTETIVRAEVGADAWQQGCCARVLRNAAQSYAAPAAAEPQAAPVRLLAVRKKPKPPPKPAG